MRDYEAIISGALTRLGKKHRFIKNPNEEIDCKVGKEQINWYPTYLVVSETKFLMFRPFCYENFLDELEIKEECENAQHLINCLKKEGIHSKVFFITNANEDVQALENQSLSDDFGILHNELERPLVDFSIRNTFSVACKLIDSPLHYLANCGNLKGKIGEQVREFSLKYLKEQPGEENEYEMIKEFIRCLLACDKRFPLDADPINLVADIEKIMLDAGGHIRDHYFHAVNTMILGFMIIDQFYDKFDKTLAKKYGEDIVLEFIWALTSLYHDIGHTVLHEEDLISLNYGLEAEQGRVLFEDCRRQMRQTLWDQLMYTFTTEVLDSLFSHITSNEPGKWVFDAFPRPVKTTPFKNSLKKSFVEEGTHGAVGALRLATLIRKPIKEIEKTKHREFLYRHMMIASMSILFHDVKVRNCFRANSIKKIRAEDFALTLLLTYADILQDDRRDLTASSSRPDIFKGVDNVEGKIIAQLERNTLTESLKKKLLDEFQEAFSFFTMNGLAFHVPEELLC